MTSQHTKLRDAIAAAQRGLTRSRLVGEETGPSVNTEDKGAAAASVRPASKLNTLLGTAHMPRDRLPLFQRVGVEQRPTYDIVAERVLGTNVATHRPSWTDSGYASHVAERLAQLRKRWDATSPVTNQDDDPSSFIGWEADGRPVWRRVLDEHRGVEPAVADDDPLPEIEMTPATSLTGHDAVSGVAWPPQVRRSSHMTFKHWFVGEENFAATQTCEGVVDRPGGSLNPLMVQAAPQSGCSHLLHATAQALLRRQSGAVLRIAESDVVGRDGPPPGWDDALAQALALVIDDLHAFVGHETWSHHLGVMVDAALNLGVQVLLGGHVSLDDVPPSRLRDVLRTATVVRLTSPSRPTLLAYARWRCSQKNLLLHDVHLAQLVEGGTEAWRSVDGALERLSLALKGGEVLLEDDDVRELLEQGTLSRPIIDAPERARVTDVARRVVGAAVDHVLTDQDLSGVALHAAPLTMNDDEYTPPSWSAEDLLAADDRAAAHHLRKTMEAVTPSMPSVLDVNERDRYLLQQHESLRFDDVERAVDTLVALEEQIDAELAASDAHVVEGSSELHQLESAMVALAQRASNADIDELITIADELRDLEERLVALDPMREPLPAFDEEPQQAPKKRRFGRRKRKQPSSSEALDSYEPEGEWNVQAEGIEASDLLEGEEETLNVVKLARLRPVNVMLGEEE